MQGAKRGPGEPVELVRSDLRGIALLLVPAAVAVVVVIMLDLSARLTAAAALTFVVVFALPVVVVRWYARRNAIFADDKGLIEVSRGRARRGPDWDEVRDASWYGGTVWFGWDPGGIDVTTDTGETRVGSIVIVGRRARRKAGEHVVAYLAMRRIGDRATE